MSGMASDFFGQLARKALQAPGLQPRRASRYEEAATHGPARWGADPAAAAELAAGEGNRAPQMSAAPLRADVPPRPQAPLGADWPAAASQESHWVQTPGRFDPARPSAPLAPVAEPPHSQQGETRAPAPGARAAELAARLAGLERMQAQGLDLAALSPLADEPAGRMRKQAAPARRAPVDRLDDAAHADAPADGGTVAHVPGGPTLAVLRLQPLDAAPSLREASGLPQPERREPAAALPTLKTLQAWQAPAPAPAPQIEIHIGRIEVLPAGVPPAAAAMAAQQAPANVRAPQSLASYLAERRRS